MDRLYIKNFGPLKEIDIQLNKINLFIGENGSGKSILAKVITIVLDAVENANKSEDEILQKFKDYNIDFISDETIIKYGVEEEVEIFILENKSIQSTMLNDISETLTSIQKNKQEILNLFSKIKSLLSIEKDSEKINSLNKTLESIEVINKELKKNDNILQTIVSKYIPAERNLISLFNKSLSSLLVADIPLPKFLLEFSSEFEKAGNELKELEFLNVRYVNGDGLDRHKVYFNEEDYLPLELSSSGIQSALPLYLIMKYFSDKYNDIIIEEPEQNLFPKAQSETIRYIIENTKKNNNIYFMTHSPYVLSTLNILMMAHKAGNLNDKSKNEVEKLIPQSQWINRDEFSAYYLENGVARNIKGKTGLISDNEIDEISEDIQYEFEELLNIYREHKNDK